MIISEFGKNWRKRGGHKYPNQGPDDLNDLEVAPNDLNDLEVAAGDLYNLEVALDDLEVVCYLEVTPDELEVAPDDLGSSWLR